jgi:hypothetical protein
MPESGKPSLGDELTVTPVPATSAAMERISPTAACVDAVCASM